MHGVVTIGTLCNTIVSTVRPGPNRNRTPHSSPSPVVDFPSSSSHPDRKTHWRLTYFPTRQTHAKWFQVSPCSAQLLLQSL